MHFGPKMAVTRLVLIRETDRWLIIFDSKHQRCLGVIVRKNTLELNICTPNVICTPGLIHLYFSIPLHFTVYLVNIQDGWSPTTPRVLALDVPIAFGKTILLG